MPTPKPSRNAGSGSPCSGCSSSASPCGPGTPARGSTPPLLRRALPFKNVSGLLLHGEFRPRHAFYLSLSYLPQTAVLAASQWLFRSTRYEPFSIYAATSDGYSPTAYWLCRMINVLYGTLSLWLLFLIGRRIYSPEVGLLAAAILAAFGRHVLSSSEFKPDILVIFLVTLTFYWTLGAAFRPGPPPLPAGGPRGGARRLDQVHGDRRGDPDHRRGARRRAARPPAMGLAAARGVASVVTFVALNPYPRRRVRVHPQAGQRLRGQGSRGAEQPLGWCSSGRWQFLIEHHGPIVTAFVALGVIGLLWRIFRPRPEDGRERRLGSILVLSLLLGYSALHALGMTLFRGQNYLPVVPFSSLVAAWAIVELWRCAGAPGSPGWPGGRSRRWSGLAVGAALLAQQGSIVYTRVVPTTFAATNDALLAELDPVGLRHVVYERGMGAFESGGKPRRPLMSPVPRLPRWRPAFLDRADVEIFPQRRLDGPDADFYRARVARLRKNQVEIVGDRLVPQPRRAAGDSPPPLDLARGPSTSGSGGRRAIRPSW